MLINTFKLSDVVFVTLINAFKLSDVVFIMVINTKLKTRRLSTSMLGSDYYDKLSLL